MSTLLLFASKYGSTQEIAERIAAILQKENHGVTLKESSEKITWDAYESVILGSSIYAGKWLPKLEKIIKTQVDVLSKKKIWLFSSGPTGEAPALETTNGWKFPAYLSSFIHQIHPMDIQLFKGKMLLENMNFLEKFIITKMKAPVGDFRNWEDIEKWAMQIASAL